MTTSSTARVSEAAEVPASFETYGEKVLFSLAFQRAPLGMWIASVDCSGDSVTYRVLRVNRAFAQMLGHSPARRSEITDERRHTHPGDLGVDRDNLRLLWAHHETSWQWEKRFLHADGHDVWARVFVSVVCGSYGTRGLLIGQAHDITMEKTAPPQPAATDASEIARLQIRCDQLQQALDSRIVIEQAKGSLAAAEGISVDEAFERIRSHARHQSVDIHEVAAAVVDLGLRP